MVTSISQTFIRLGLGGRFAGFDLDILGELVEGQFLIVPQVCLQELIEDRLGKPCLQGDVALLPWVVNSQSTVLALQIGNLILKVFVAVQVDLQKFIIIDEIDGDL